MSFSVLFLHSHIIVIHGVNFYITVFIVTRVEQVWGVNLCYRVCTLFQNQFSRTFPGLDRFSSSSKCTITEAINPYEIEIQK